MTRDDIDRLVRAKVVEVLDDPQRVDEAVARARRYLGPIRLDHPRLIELAEGVAANVGRSFNEGFGSNDWLIGAQPDPKDRRRITVEDWGSDRIRSLDYGQRVAGVTDLITGEDLVLRRADCGGGCRCALEIVPPGSYLTVHYTPVPPAPPVQVSVRRVSNEEFFARDKKGDR